jgi:hypothetical protein
LKDTADELRQYFRRRQKRRQHFPKPSKVLRQH